MSNSIAKVALVTFVFHAGVVAANVPPPLNNQSPTNAVNSADAGKPVNAEVRALRFLELQVDSWPRENKCFSCHNNGDAARTLLIAKQLGHTVALPRLASTLDWLQHPERWDDYGDKADFSDPLLATTQFSAALAAAVRAELLPKRPLSPAAAKLVQFQHDDGSWKIGAPGIVGAPATYGHCLATVLARDVLEQADKQRFQAKIARATAWLAKQDPKTVLDAAAILWGGSRDNHEQSKMQTSNCREIIAKGEHPEGGWGPYVTSAPEPFDTAIVLLALSRQPPAANTSQLIQRGRHFLLHSQLEDGSWPESTRPPGGVSYAQQISTSAWATLAIISTSKRPN